MATATTDENGTVTFTGLAWGTYTAQETKPADGYSLTDQNSEKPVQAKFTIDSENVSAQMDLGTFTNEQTSLTLRKQSETGEVLSGAKFTLVGKYVNESGITVNGTMSLTTNAQGIMELKGALIAGESYTLTETEAPEGYALLNGSLEFTVQADGSIVIRESAEGYVLTKAGYFDNQIVVTDPVKPDEPDEPDEPDNPNNPDKPDNPDNPDKPDKPN